MNAMHLDAVFEWVVDETDLHSCTCKSWGKISLIKLTKIVFTVFHNRASDILQGSKQWWTLDSKNFTRVRTLEPSQDRRLC